MKEISTTKTLLGLCVAFCLSESAFAQKTQTEVVKSSGEQEDKRPNSDAIPDVVAHSLQFERIVIARLNFRTDLLTGLEKAVVQQNIKNGVILSGFGSVRGYHVHGVNNANFPSSNFYVKNPRHPADIISVNGMVLGGRIHAHITLVDDERAFGGHLELGSEVFTFAVVTIGVLPDDVDLTRLDDKTYR